MLDWEQALAYGKGMADGMAVLHGHTPPIFHRDMKSLNLLVNKDNIVKVCDFGLSRIVEQPAMVTLKNLRGTLAYCAPEIMAGVQFSAKSDVYSMGIVIWELIFVVVTYVKARIVSKSTHTSTLDTSMNSHLPNLGWLWNMLF